MNDLKFIYNQKNDPSANIKLGLKKSSFNGCGWIATYNALILLNRIIDTSEIITYYKKYGLILLGVFGISPFAVTRYFKKLKFNVNRLLLPKKSLDDIIKNDSDASILFFMHSHGCHFITVAYNHKENLFNAYNVFSNSNGVDKFLSLDKLLSDYSFRPLILINIKNNG